MYKVNQKTAPDAFALRSLLVLKINLYLTSVTKKRKKSRHSVQFIVKSSWTFIFLVQQKNLLQKIANIKETKWMI